MVRTFGYKSEDNRYRGVAFFCITSAFLLLGWFVSSQAAPATPTQQIYRWLAPVFLVWLIGYACYYFLQQKNARVITNGSRLTVVDFLGRTTLQATLSSVRLKDRARRFRPGPVWFVTDEGNFAVYHGMRERDGFLNYLAGEGISSFSYRLNGNKLKIGLIEYLYLIACAALVYWIPVASGSLVGCLLARFMSAPGPRVTLYPDEIICTDVLGKIMLRSKLEEVLEVRSRRPRPSWPETCTIVTAEGKFSFDSRTVRYPELVARLQALVPSSTAPLTA